MRTFSRILYSVVFVNLLYLGFFISFLFDGKIRKAFIGRFGLWRRYRKNLGPKNGKKRIWFHVSSVGELEQAKPLMRLLNERNKESVDIVLTVFSPSALKSASKVEAVSFYDYLPLDTYFNSKKAFDILQPDLVVFVKFDIWPNIVWEAYDRKVPQVLIDGTLHRKSHRYSNIMGQAFYNSLYTCFDLIGTVSDSDLKRFLITSPKYKNVKILGDTRYDQVAFRARNAENSVNAKKIPPCMYEYKKGVTLICGSTWEADDRAIVQPLKKILSENRNLNLVMVPHEPSKRRVSNYLEEFKDFSPRALSALNDKFDNTKVTVVDKVGFLAELYKIGHIAYVGGAFSTGVHNVMEPAIMGLAVAFGPFHYNSPEAEALVRMNCAFSGSTEDDFYSIFKKLVMDKEYAKQTGLKAQSFIQSNLGADERYYKEIVQFI
jgi:3-deoxy-D-manno-octulosonic-acid transferase